MGDINYSQIAGIVLSGGQSSRMGQDKAQLEYKGKLLLDHMVAILNSSGIENVFISGKDEMPDLNASAGPLSGILTALTTLDKRFDYLLIVPVDMPLLEPGLVSKLLAYDSLAEAVYFNGFQFPLKLSASENIKKIISHHLELGKLDKRKASVKGLLASLSTDCLHLSENEELLFKNINTPKEWEGL